MGEGDLRMERGKKRWIAVAIAVWGLAVLMVALGNGPAVAALTGGYYVDINNGSDATGDGSETNPWKTLHYAFGLSAGLADGDTVHVMPGSYNASSEGSDTPLVIETADLHLIGECWPEINGYYGSAWTTGIEINAAGVTVEGFKINGFADGITAENQSPTIKRNIIFSMTQSGISVSSTSSISDEISPLIENNLIYECGLRGIYVSGYGNGGAPEIYHNTIDAKYYNSAVGISINEITAPSISIAPVIKFNIITNFSSTGGTGIANTNADTGGITIDYNDVWNNAVNYSPGLSHITDLNTEPWYIDSTSADYQLQYKSPCIDAIPDTAGDTVTDDLLGQERLTADPDITEIDGIDNGGIYDMGAYEKIEDADRDGLNWNAEDLNFNFSLDTDETDPDNWDTDGDGYHDGEEIAKGTPPYAFGTFPTYGPDIYYVDANQTWLGLGTVDDPWQTLHLAVHHINNGTESTESSPYTLNVLAGLYSAGCCADNWEPHDESLSITQSYVTIAGAGKDLTIVDGNACESLYGYGWMNGFVIDGAHHVTIRDMTIRNFVDIGYYGGGSGVKMEGANSCAVANCRIYGNSLYGVKIAMSYLSYTPSEYNRVKDGCEIFHNGEAGVYIGESNYNEVRENRASIYDNGPVGTPGAGVVIEGNSSFQADFNQVVNNRIYASAGDADYAQGAGVKIIGEGEGNLVAANEIFGHILGDACGVWTDNADVVIQRNTLKDNGTGVVVEGSAEGSITPSIVNNLIYRSSTSLVDVLDGIHIHNDGGYNAAPKIHHNTIDNGAQFGISINSPTRALMTGTDIQFNNITGFAGAGIYCFGSGAYGDGIISIDYNDVDGNGTDNDYVNTPADAAVNDISEPPLYIDAGSGDYHLGAGSPCIDVIPVSPVSLDHDGIDRPQGAAYDMGAFEDSEPASAGSLSGLPDTGQSECYDDGTILDPCPDPGAAFYGQDHQYQPQHPRSYTKLGDGGVELENYALHADDGGPWTMTRDNVTGLVWEVKTVANSGETFNWADASAVFVAGLNSAGFGGFNNWRLPTAKELASLVNLGKWDPSIDSFWFPNTGQDFYWTSSPDPYSSDNRLGISFEKGWDGGENENNPNYVRAVRGDTPEIFSDGVAAGRLVDNGDGTLTDTGTGLMWQQAAEATTFIWEDALDYAENSLELAGYTDWRLPNLVELRSLLDYTRSESPFADPLLFPDAGTIGWYWSSTSYAAWPATANAIHFGEGGDYQHLKNQTVDPYFRAYARAVRGGQFSSSEKLVVSAPLQGGHYAMGALFSITWDPVAFSGTVKISLSRDGGASWETITEDADNTGSFEWTASGMATANGVLRIEETGDPSVFAETGFFTLGDLSSVIGPGTYYVDSENGNDANDGLSWDTSWRTLYYAINQINNGTSGDEVSGYTLNVAAGEYKMTTGGYEPNLDLDITQSHLTIVGAGSATILDGTSGTAYGWSDGFDIQGPATDVVIQNLTIRNFVANGVHMGGAENCTVDSCSIYNNSNNGILVEDGGDPWSSCSDCTIRNGCEIYENGASGVFIYNAAGIIVDDCRIYGNYNNGIYIESGSDHRIRNDCAIFNNFYHGISIFESSGNQILNNRGSIFDNGIPGDEICGILIVGSASTNNLIKENDIYTTGPVGYFQEIGVRLQGVGSGNQVIANTIYGHQADEVNEYDGFGIEVVNCSPDIMQNILHDNTECVVAMSEDGGTASPNIWNNLIYGDPAASTMRAGIMLEIEYDAGYSGDLGFLSPVIYHNTIDGATEAGIEIDVDTSYGGSGQPDIAFNIISNTGVVGIRNTVGYADPAVDTNDLWNTGADYYLNFASSPLDDIHVDPRYVGSGNYHLQSSSECIDVIPGTAAHPVDVDLDGTARPQPEEGDFDLGCYETEAEPSEPSYYKVSFKAGTGGRVDGDKTQTVLKGKDCTPVEAVPDAGYWFTGWTGSYTGTANPLTITNVRSDKNITANFEQEILYAVSFGAGPGGSLSGNTSQSILAGGSSSPVEAIPAEGYEFEGWTGSYTGTANPLSLTNVSADKNIVANFKIKTYPVTAEAGAGGGITGETSQTVEHGGTTTTFTAVASPHYHFTGWSGDYVGMENPLVIHNVTSDLHIIANFAIDTYTVVFSASAGGYIEGQTEQIIDYGGSSASVTAVPEPGHEFTGWSGDSGESGTSLVFANVTKDMAATANFAVNSPPGQPLLISPIGNAIVEPTAVILMVGSFVDPEGDAHVESRWQIWRAGESNPFYDVASSTDLTRHTPGTVFENGLRYEWRAGFVDGGSGLVAWSVRANFITGSPETDDNIPAIPPGFTLKDYRLMSFIQYPADNPFAQQGNMITSLAMDPEDFKLGTYDPLTGGYDQYPDVEIEPGLAYWILARYGMDFSMEGVFVSTDQDFTLGLQYNEATGNGWNMIGVPNGAHYRWYDLEVMETDDQGNILNGPTPISLLPEDNEYVDNRIWRWADGGYTSDNSDTFVMQPYEGVWVKARKKNIALMFPVSAQSQVSQVASVLLKGKKWLTGVMDLITPAYAGQGEDDSPPMPMAVGDSGGSTGGCFIDLIVETK